MYISYFVVDRYSLCSTTHRVCMMMYQHPSSTLEYFFFFFLRDFIFKKTLFEKLQYLKQAYYYINKHIWILYSTLEYDSCMHLFISCAPRYVFDCFLLQWRIYFPWRQNVSRTLSVGTHSHRWLLLPSISLPEQVIYLSRWSTGQIQRCHLLPAHAYVWDGVDGRTGW